jgi:hypothetical protein
MRNSVTVRILKTIQLAKKVEFLTVFELTQEAKL